VLSPAQQALIKELILGKWVLDLGEKDSPFIADLFAFDAKAWSVFGRFPPSLSVILPKHCVITNAPFEPKTPAAEIDVILFTVPGISSHYEEALDWATSDQVMVVLMKVSEATCGTASFWEKVQKFVPQQDLKEEKGLRVLVIRKAGAPPVEEEEKEEYHRKFPRQGDRYHLAPLAHWPGKKPGDRPPKVKIAEDWTKASGAVIIIGTGQMVHIHLGDLGSAL
jgi:hypothetical protein